MKKHEFSDKDRKIIAAAGVAVFVIMSAFIIWFVGRPMVKFVSEPDKFRAWIDGHGVWGKLAYCGMVILQVFFALIPGEPLEIGAGYAFGAVTGTILCLLAATAGSMIVFLFIRRYGTRAAEIFFSKEKLDKLNFLQRVKKKELLLFILFLIPGTPKDVLCYFAGLTDIKLTTWLFICSIGRIPSVTTSTIGGDALGLMNYKGALVVLAITVAVSGIGFLVYRLLLQYNSRKLSNSTKRSKT